LNFSMPKRAAWNGKDSLSANSSVGLNMNIIETDQLSKSFGETRAVQDVSLHVREGEIYGLLGLNGAGKTTAIRLLLGMIKPDSGSWKLFGQNIQQGSRQWNKIGYLVETAHAYPDLTVRQNIELFYKLRGLANPKDVDEILNILKLDRYSTKKARNLSLGNKQRLGLAKAILHKPELLILDEPVNGLDPAGIVEIREYLAELAHNAKITIFLSSHILSEIAKLATRIGIVHEGRLIREINSSDIDLQIIRKLVINTSDNLKAQKLLTQRQYKFEQQENELLTCSDAAVVKTPEAIADIIVRAELDLYKLDVIEEDLEHYFLRMIDQENMV